MFSQARLKTKMLLSICGVAFLAFAVTILVISNFASRHAVKAAEDLAIESAYRYGSQIRSEMEIASDSARNLAHVVAATAHEDTALSRSQLIAMMKGILEENPSFYGIWGNWLPDAFDGSDKDYAGTPGSSEKGRFLPYWYRSAGELKFDKTDEPTETAANGEWFWTPFKTGKEFITKPLTFTIDGENQQLVGICVPVRINGRSVGVVGIDLKTSQLQEIILGIRPFGEKHSYGFLLSNGGYGVAHPAKKAIGAHMRDFNISESIISAVREGRLITEHGRSALLGGKSLTTYAPIQIGRNEAPWSLAIGVSMEKVMEQANILRNLCFAIGFGAVLVLFLVVYLISDRIIVRPINDVSIGLRDIAEGEGDLTKRLPVNKNDEIGELVGWFNTFMDQLRGIIAEVQQNAATVNTASEGLLGVSGKMRENAGDTANNASRVASATEETSTGIQTMAATMDQAASNINMVASATEEMTATIQEIAKNAETARTISDDAVATSNTASEKMGVLGSAATDIGAVTATITDISEQTNLLALNATIEAARAGEAGKGFAVVAGEIKELSRQTAEATQEIRGRIEGIQQVTDEAVTAITAVGRIISEISDINGTIATAVEEQSAATREIAGNIMQASSGIQEVNEAVSQTSVAASEISSDIADVNHNTERMQENSAQVNRNARELAELGQTLTGLVGRFNV